MLKIFPIMLALCFMLSSPYYAENYAGIIDTSLVFIPCLPTYLLYSMNATKHVKNQYTLMTVKFSIKVVSICIIHFNYKLTELSYATALRQRIMPTQIIIYMHIKGVAPPN